jgi:dimethylamine monooxygenase subunit A
MPFDFSAVRAPFRMQPGLRRLANGATQLTPNRPDSRALHEKLAVLRDHARHALLAAPGFDAVPALRALVQHAAGEHPDALVWDGGSRIDAPHIGWSLHDGATVGRGPEPIGACLRALPAEWRLPALLSLAFAEDFAVIDGQSGRIPWLAVCLPSHWAPEQKVGRHFAEVHAPVADNELLITASAHLARLVTGAERWERFVWTITRHPNLDSHPLRCAPGVWPAGGDADIDTEADALAAQAFFRTERQTFIPLPLHGQAIFTIHVESQALASAITDAVQARQVHEALASMSASVLAYRGLTAVQSRLLAWLAARASEPGRA